MSNKEKLMDILEHDLYPVINTDETYIDTNNGILNNDLVERRKRVFLKDSMTYLLNEVVKVTQDYPQDNLSKVTFDTHFYIIKPKDLAKLIELVENLEDE